jgi:hypothetical protein
MGVSGQCHNLDVLYTWGRTPGTHWLGGLRAGLDTWAKGKIFCLCWGLKPGRPVSSQTYTDFFAVHLTSPKNSPYNTMEWK